MIGTPYCSQKLCISSSQAVQLVWRGLYIPTSHDLTMVRIARDVRRYSSEVIGSCGGGSPSSSSRGFSQSGVDSAAFCKSSVLRDVFIWALVDTARALAPVAVAPVRIVPTD